MWPRRARNGAAEEAELRLEAERIDRAWAEWERRWNRPEEERLARARRSHESPVFEIVRQPDARPHPRPRRDVPPHADDRDTAVVRTEVTALRQQRTALVGAVAALRDEVEVLEGRRRDQARAIDEEAAALAALRAERRHLEAEVEDKRAEIEAQQRWLEQHEGGRPVVDTVQGDGSGAGSVRRLREDASVRLEQEVSALENQRSALIDTVRAAALSAEQARSAERLALSRLEKAKERARNWEADRTDVWIALDEEIDVVEHRVDSFRGSGPPGRS